LCKLRFNGGDHVIQVGEVSIMQAAASSQLPYSLDWIQFGAIRRQVVQSKIVGVFVSPRLMKQGVMVFGIVGDYNHPATGSDTDAPEALHESKESRAIELAGLTTELKSSVPQPHSTKVSNAVPCRSVQQNGVFGFWRNPHPASGAMLLEVHFVDGPEIDCLVGH
jgi:hypothetical protein